MPTSKIIFSKTDYYVSERAFVEVLLFDEVQQGQAVGLSPLLTFTRPDNTTISVTMGEVGSVDNPGLYRGSVVLDAEGTWTVEVIAGIPDGSVFRYHGLYVAA